MAEIIGIIGYGFIAIFGVVLSAAFSGIEVNRSSAVRICLFCLGAILLQVTCRMHLGLSATRGIYPLIVHLPLLVFLRTGFKVPWLNAGVSILTAYQCCQIPRVLAAVSYFFTDEVLYKNILYILFVPLIGTVLYRYAAKPVQRFMCKSQRTVFFLGVVPLVYYIFDYFTTVYTDLLFSGEPFAVLFMPSAMATFYFFYVVLFYSQMEEKEKAGAERDLMAMQIKRSESELREIRLMRDQAREYRHDLRHHFVLLTGLAESGNLTGIKKYIQSVDQDLRTFSPNTHFCENETADLILDHFNQKAKEQRVTLLIKAELQKRLSVTDTELCSLLSNGLENAISAAARVPEESGRTVNISIFVRQKNLMISIRNAYSGNIVMKDGIPQTEREGHGIGAKSISSIVNHHNGQVSFSAENGVFRLRIMLPMD